MAGKGRAACATSDKLEIERLTEYEASASATSVLVGAGGGGVDEQAHSTRKEEMIVTSLIFMTVIFSLIFTSAP